MEPKTRSIFVRTYYAPGLSSLTLKYFNVYLAFHFAPSLGMKNSLSLEDYCSKTSQSTSINHHGAGTLYLAIKKVLDESDSDKQVEVEIKCNKDAKLIFEYKPDGDNQMRAYLTIHKNSKVIPFKFATNEIQIIKNGEKVKKTLQSGLASFYKVVEGYLTIKESENRTGTLEGGLITI